MCEWKRSSGGRIVNRGKEGIRGSVRMTVKTDLKTMCGGVNRGKVRDF